MLRRGSSHHRAYKSHFDEVMAGVRDRAIFWERVSASTFLGALALVGLLMLWQGSMLLTTGTQDITVLQRLVGQTTWSARLMGLGLLGFGLNLIAPLPLYWTVKDRTAIIIVCSFLAVNLCVFFYGYFLGVLASF